VAVSWQRTLYQISGIPEVDVHFATGSSRQSELHIASVPQKGPSHTQFLILFAHGDWVNAMYLVVVRRRIEFNNKPCTLFEAEREGQSALVVVITGNVH